MKILDDNLEVYIKCNAPGVAYLLKTAANLECSQLLQAYILLSCRMHEGLALCL